MSTLEIRPPPGFSWKRFAGIIGAIGLSVSMWAFAAIAVIGLILKLYGH